MLHAVDVFFTILHLVIIGFNMFGWIWPATRRAHLVTILLTGASWFLLGIWFGMGYCPITDWQWQVKEKLGEKNLPSSFIKYFGDKLTGMDLDSSLVNSITLVTFLVALVLSCYLNFFYHRTIKN